MSRAQNQQTYERALNLLALAVEQKNVEQIEALMPVVESYKPEPTETPPTGSRALRGLENAWEGFRQANTQMSEAAGVVPEGTSEAYTREQLAEREAFEEHTTPSTVGDVEEGIAEILPYALTTRRGPGMAMGTVEGATQFQENEDLKDRALGAVLGGTLGGIAGTADEAAQGVRIDPGKMSDQAKRGVVEARERGERLRPIDITTDPRARRMQNLAYQGRWGEDVSRLAQDAEKEARRIADQYNRTGDKSVLGGYKRKLKELEDIESEMYDQAYVQVGHAPLDVGKTTGDMENIMRRYEGQGGDWRKQRRVVDYLTSEGLPSGTTVQDWRKFRTNIRKQMKLFDRKGWDQKPLEDIYWSVTKNIDEAAERVDPIGAAALREANDFTMKHVVPVDDLIDPKKVGETKFVQKFRNASPEEARDMVKALDQDGQTDLMYRLHEGALAKSIDQGRKTGFSPAHYASELEKNMHLFDAMGDKETAQGLVDFLRTAQDITRDAANLPTGRTQTGLTGWQTMMAYNPLPALMARSSEFRGLAARLARQQAGDKVPFKRSKEEIASRMLTLMIQAGRAEAVKSGTDWLNEAGYEVPSAPSIMQPHPSETR